MYQLDLHSEHETKILSRKAMVVREPKQPDYWAGIHLELDGAEYAQQSHGSTATQRNWLADHYVQQTMNSDWYMSDIKNTFFVNK